MWDYAAIIMENHTSQAFPAILQQWTKKNKEAILCQRTISNSITFTPVWIEATTENKMQLWLPKKEWSHLKYSTQYFKTVTVVAHRSTKSDPNANKGFFIVAAIENISEKNAQETSKVPKTYLWNVKMSESLLLITIRLIRASFWSGIHFGTFKWQKLPKNIPKNYKKRLLFPRWTSSKKITPKEEKILTRSQLLYIAVVTKYGYLHVTPVHFVHLKNRVYLATSLQSAKMKGFKFSNIAAGYTYPTTKQRSEYHNALTIQGHAFSYGWSFWTALAYGLLFFPYLLYITFRMWRKYPVTIKNFPTKQTPYSWNFIPLVGRTFIEIVWDEDEKEHV